MTGCFLSKKINYHPREQPDIANPIAEERMRSILQNRSFVYAFVPDNMYPELVQELARKMNLRVTYIETDAETLSSLIRSGRADLGSGGLTIEKIESYNLTPVLKYNDSFAFMIRKKDDVWKEMLEKAFAEIEMHEENTIIPEEK